MSNVSLIDDSFVATIRQRDEYNRHDIFTAENNKVTIFQDVTFTALYSSCTEADKLDLLVS